MCGYKTCANTEWIHGRYYCPSFTRLPRIFSFIFSQTGNIPLLTGIYHRRWKYVKLILGNRTVIRYNYNAEENTVTIHSTYEGVMKRITFLSTAASSHRTYASARKLECVFKLTLFHMKIWNSFKLMAETGCLSVGRDSSVGTATRYGLDRPGIESRWATRFFRTRPGLSWGPPTLLYNGYRVSFSGVKRPGCGVDHTPHLAPRLKKV